MSRGYVIGLGSLPGAGKSALTEQLVTRGLEHLHVGTIVRSIAADQGFIPADNTREAYLPFWREYAAEHGQDWLAKIAFSTANDKKAGVVLDGVRIPADAQTVRRANNGKLIWIDGDLPVLAQRLLDRDRVEDAELETLEAHTEALQRQLDDTSGFSLGAVRELAEIRLFPTVQIDDLTARQQYYGRQAASLIDLCGPEIAESY